jgi:dihydrofolate synthase/folylpolyglutamate synthase
MEWVGGHTLLDGAHNASGAQALARAIRPRAPFSLVMGLLGPKDPLSVIAPLRPLAGRAIFTRPRSPRAIAPEVLAGLVPGSEVAPDLRAALQRLAGAGDAPTLITGSLYLVGEARGLLLGEPCDAVRTADPIAVSPATP